MPRTVFPEHNKTSRRQISLKQYFLVPFLILFTVTVLFFCWFSYFSARKTIKEFQGIIAEEISAGVAQQLSKFFSITSAVTKVNSDFVRAGRLDINDFDSMQKHFLAQIKNLKHLAFISFGSVNGEYISAARSPDSGQLSVMTSRRADGFRLKNYNVNEISERTTLISTGTKLDARRRPWYTHAEKTRRAGWYSVYKYIPYDGLGIGVSAPVFDNMGEMAGVVSADMSLSRVSAYLKNLKLGKNGFAYITEEDGTLVGSSLDFPVYRKEGQVTTRYNLGNYPDERLRAIAGFKKLKDAPFGEEFFNINGENYLINKRMFTDEFGLSLVVGIVLAEKDYTVNFDQNLRMAAAVIIIAAILGWIAIIRIADYLARPIETLNRQVIDMSEGNLNQPMDVDINVMEIKQLGDSFKTMAGRLSESFSTLEKKISERTEELSMANKKLLELSITDELTGLANRRHFNDVLAREWSHSSRSGQPVSLLILDIDYFKNYNDRYGHQAGDECLRRVAFVIKDNVKRVTDLAARYGGEEFAVIMPNTDINKAPIVAEYIKTAVERCRIIHENSPIGSITVSIGYACLTADDKHTVDDLIKKADNALYKAKENGRNRISGGD